MIDIEFQNCGFIAIMVAHTPAGKAWVADYISQNDETQYWAGGIVVEHRYVDDIAEGALAEGLDVSVGGV